MSLQLFLIILSGVLAAACPGVLEGVEARRLRNGWGLTEPARPGDVLLGLEDCGLLGKRGMVVVDGESHAAYVVDCQQAAHRMTQPMGKRGLVADIGGPMAEELNHRTATVMVLR